jgi:hypothetical protein
MNISVRMTFLIFAFLFLGVSARVDAREPATASDSDIKVVHFEPLNYPTIAQSAHIEGVVVLRVMLNDKADVIFRTSACSVQFGVIARRFL